MIITNDERIAALRRGESPEGVRDVSALQDAVAALDAASRVEDTLYAGSRVIRVVTQRRRRYYVDVGSAQWITFEWRVHDAINVRLVRLRRTNLGAAFRR